MSARRAFVAGLALAFAAACASDAGPGAEVTALDLTDAPDETPAPARVADAAEAAAEAPGGNRTGPDTPEARPGNVFDHPVTAHELTRDLGPVTATLRDAQVLRGLYSQTKRLADVPRPLLAQGSFLFARDTGLLWRTTKPFESELVITRNEILQREPGGGLVRVSADDHPAVRSVAAIFFAVFALDFDALESMFQLYSRGFGAGWELGLRPKAGATGPIREIVVSGDRHVERVLLRDARDDTTDIRLRNTAASRSRLSADEMTVFQP